MNKGVLIPVIAGIFFLGVIGLSENVYAPPPEKAEKIRIDSISFDEAAKQVTVSSSAKFGQATSGENAGFQICATLTITDPLGNNLATVGPQCDPVQKQEGATKDADGYVSLVPQIIGWDAGAFSGTATVSASTELKNPSGGTVGNSSTETSGDVEVEGPPSISPTSGGYGCPFTITDPQGRIQPGDGIFFSNPNSQSPVGGSIGNFINPNTIQGEVDTLLFKFGEGLYQVDVADPITGEPRFPESLSLFLDESNSCTSFIFPLEAGQSNSNFAIFDQQGRFEFGTSYEVHFVDETGNPSRADVVIFTDPFTLCRGIENARGICEIPQLDSGVYTVQVFDSSHFELLLEFDNYEIFL